MYQLTFWLDPDEKITTVKGTSTSLEWLGHERDRIIGHGKKAYIRDGNETERYKGKYCLMVDNPIAESLDDFEYKGPCVKKEEINEEPPCP